MISQRDVMQKYGISKCLLNELVKSGQLKRIIPGKRRYFYDEVEIIKILGSSNTMSELILKLAQQQFCLLPVGVVSQMLEKSSPQEATISKQKKEI